MAQQRKKSKQEIDSMSAALITETWLQNHDQE
jgi:RNase H-fold protein (predicted Holliday junction resolvase)